MCLWLICKIYYQILKRKSSNLLNEKYLFYFIYNLFWSFLLRQVYLFIVNGRTSGKSCVVDCRNSNLIDSPLQIDFQWQVTILGPQIDSPLQIKFHRIYYPLKETRTASYTCSTLFKHDRAVPWRICDVLYEYNYTV